MLKKKQAGVAVPKGQAAAPARNVVNLMDALKRSIASEKKAAPKGKKRMQGQSEMLLPISGRKGKEAAAAPVARQAARQKKASVRRFSPASWLFARSLRRTFCEAFELSAFPCLRLISPFLSPIDRKQGGVLGPHLN
jgi:hypothetical protein